jgi:hypothetical protein
MVRIWHDLLFFPFLRGLLGHEHIIARYLTQSAPSRTPDLADPAAPVRLPDEPFRLAPLLGGADRQVYVTPAMKLRTPLQLAERNLKPAR